MRSPRWASTEYARPPWPPSSSGLGHHPLKVAARVRIPLGVLRGSVGNADHMASYRASGAFSRDTTYLTTRITADGRDGSPVEPGRYRLVVARACPWANRAIIVRRLLGLEPVLSMAITGPTHDDRSWDFRETTPGGRDPVLGIERLQEAYLARDPDYDKGVTVPAIGDRRT